jgi:hypothetical protein
MPTIFPHQFLFRPEAAEGQRDNNYIIEELTLVPPESVEEQEGMEDFNRAPNSRAVMARTVCELESVGKLFGAPGACAAHAELCGLVPHSLFNL